VAGETIGDRHRTVDEGAGDEVFVALETELVLRKLEQVLLGEVVAVEAQFVPEGGMDRGGAVGRARPLFGAVDRLLDAGLVVLVEQVFEMGLAKFVEGGQGGDAVEEEALDRVVGHRIGAATERCGAAQEQEQQEERRSQSHHGRLHGLHGLVVTVASTGVSRS